MLYHSFTNYAKYAWGANEYRPISKQTHTTDIFGNQSLGITIIDSIDTLYIAKLDVEYRKARNWIEKQFNPNVMFLDKAILVADRLLPAFNTPTGIPNSLIILSTGSSNNWIWAPGQCSILSELGTMHLEFQYLTQLSGKKIYREIVEKVRTVLQEAAENHMYYNYISSSTGKWCQKYASLGAMGDSFYEYLLKSWLLSGKTDERARTMFQNSMKAAEESMLRKTPTTNLLYFGEQRSERLDLQMGHLTCFVGGLYGLSSQHISNNDSKYQMDIAKGIAQTCREAYIRSDTRLGPETFHFERQDVEAKSLRDNEKYYILRPEAIETWFYLWRLTHEQIYRDWAWDAIISLEKYCRVDGGYTGIHNVYTISPSQDDVQQSFYLAETLKYLYLIYSEDSVISLSKYVFNTEAHPFKLETPVEFERGI
ncbi:unnamed protein product [Didymodactylos carnosus]|uniref:alpha-1,2-Mannosidase n=4 Tax=Didymodactylos carnosus TaxID=1234261 RepID=A0A813VHZ4_9BILA|nr:unnamed protein product [Didymodactylos carnosus]CAF3630805.1 unnamed protein product [Didymodactylos carnosus]